MDSEDSLPGSSASNSSTNSSENSRQTPSPSLTKQEERPKSPLAEPAVASPQSSAEVERFRPRSRSSNEGMISPRSISKSDSDSSSSSSSSDNENDDDANSAVSALQDKSNKFSDRSSSDGSPKHLRISGGSRNQSASPAVKSRPSSRNSSSSSNNSRSRSNSRDENQRVDTSVNITHEDLSDVSDMESEKRASSFNNSKQSLNDEGINNSMSATVLQDEADLAQLKRSFSSEGDNSQNAVITDLRQKLDQKKNFVKVTEINKETFGDTAIIKENVASEPLEDFVKTHDEDSLDFEAEEGECQEVSKDEDINPGSDKEIKKANEKSDGEAEDGEELEEGEVSDEDEKRPEETEPKPVCRFYTRGQCTWGMSCRFLHPGVTDKGNYTMFDLVRPVPVPQQSTGGSRASSYAPHASADYHDYRTERPPLHHRTALLPTAAYSAHHDARTLLPDGPIVVESAWERGLRTAKEMMRKANKRKEQDMDFEDKKMNLTLSPDELEKDPYYLKDRGSPQDAVLPYGRHTVYQEVATAAIYNAADRFSRGPPVPPSYDEVDPYGRTTRYRELPPHRMPQYEDDRRVRPTREVIVQRVETVGRGDEWNDPWMRSKSPGGGRGGSRERGDKRHRDRRSYSSNSSYSSSSSSQSDSSSDSSRSPSPGDHKRRYNSSSHKASSPARRHNVRSARSPSLPPRRTRRSPSVRHSSIVKRRGQLSVSPVLDKRSAYSPVHKHKKQSPILKHASNEKSNAKRRTSSSSGSGSSDSSGSDSDTDSGSSTSDSSSLSKRRTPPPKRSRLSEKTVSQRKPANKVDPPKKRSPISIEIKKQATVGASALISPTHSISSEKDSKKSRREELLKQLRAVEDAIAKKRSKLA